MKTNAIVRIVIYSVLTALLLCLLIGGIHLGSLHFSVDDGHSYSLGSASVDVSSIHNLEIEWAAGSITLQTADTDKITFSETGSSSAPQLAYRIEGQTLILRYSKPSFSIGLLSMPKKDLAVTVPKDWDCHILELESASTKITATGLKAEKINLESASGTCHFSDCTVGDLDVDTASGDITYTGTLNTLDCDAASADFTGVFTNTPKRITMDAASGDLDITLPENCGYELDMDTLSGDFQSDFGNANIYGDGSCKISMDGASGDVRIRKPSGGA